MQPLNFIILGPPGTGKGTQAQKLASRFNLKYIATGDFLRDLIQKNSKTGKEVRKYLDKGELVRNEIINDYIKKKINKLSTSRGLIFDGFPRNVEQAEDFKKILRDTKRNNLKVIYIKSSEEALMRRLSNRKICEKCKKIFSHPPANMKKCSQCGGELFVRNDDRPRVVKQRLQVYTTQTKPLVDYYKKEGNLIEINGDQSIEEVFKEIVKKIGNSCSKSGTNITRIKQH